MTNASSVLKHPLLARTFVELADTLVDDFDVVDLLSLLSERCVEILGVSSAGLLLTSAEGELRVMASSSEAMRAVELFELQSQEGPCFDCVCSGKQIANSDLATAQELWPRFAREALNAGFHSVLALPMSLRGSVVGALNLFSDQVGLMDEQDVVVAQSLADIATIAIFQQRAASESQVINTNLNIALNSRVTIEQAKGILSERLGIDMAEAFSHLRGYARSHNLLLVNVAQTIIDGTLEIHR